jgi:hypothetical protein
MSGGIMDEEFTEALHVGVRFNPVELYLRAPNEDIAVWSPTALGVQNIFKGFVKTVRDSATN